MFDEPLNVGEKVKKIGKGVRFTGSLWNGHECCVVLVHEDDARNKP